MNRANDRRRFWRLLVHPGLQFRSSSFFLAMLFLLVISNCALFFAFLVRLVNMGNSMEPGTAVSIILFSAAEQNVWLLTGVVAVTLLIMLLFSIKMTHRIAGPAYALRRHIDELIAGNYHHKTKLRDGDQLTQLQDRLNALSDQLTDGHPEKNNEDSSNSQNVSNSPS